jgi:uncharacterized delta-60 repeat protein
MKLEKMNIKLTTIYLLFYLKLFSQNQTDKDFYFSANVNPNFQHSVYCFNQQSNNKIIVGSVSSANYAVDNSKYIRRINLDGTPDNSFTPPIMIGNTERIFVQTDDKLIIGTTHLYGVGGNQKDIMRLNSNGTIDQQFQNNLNYITGNIGGKGIAIQNDNKILASGFCSTVDNINIKGLIRLNSNGLRDISFNLQGNGYYPSAPLKILQLQNGKILTSGRFSSYNNISYNGLVRLNSDGSLDNTFTIGTGFQNSLVNSFGIQSDGKIIVVGGFTSFNGYAKRYLIRLNTDGTIDNTFLVSNLINNSVDDILILPDDKILVIGIFSKKLVKLNANGSTDSSFDVGIGFNSASRIIGLYKQTDNQFLIGGTFNQYQSTTSNGILRLLGNSVLDIESFNSNIINIYPNPVKETINILNISTMDFKIYDLLGKLVLQGISNDNQINVSDLEKGIYILQLKKDGEILKQKFIKE